MRSLLLIVFGLSLIGAANADTTKSVDNTSYHCQWILVGDGWHKVCR